MGEFKVRDVSVEEKSSQQIEQELVEEATNSKDNEVAQEEVVQNDSEQASTEESTEAASNQDETTGTTQGDYVISDEDVLSYIKNKTDKDFSSIDEIFSSTENSTEIEYEDVNAFLQYKKETGRSLKDYMELNRDFDGMDDDSLLRSFYAHENEGVDLTRDEIDFMIEEKFGYDSDMDEDREIKRKQLNKKTEIAKAKKFFNEQKEKYKAPLESSSPLIPENEKEEYNSFKQYKESLRSQEELTNKQREHYSSVTEKLFSENFEGFDFTVGDGEDSKVVKYPVEDVSKVKEVQMDARNFINKYLDDNGMLSDSEGFHKALNVAMNADSFAKYFYNLGAAEAIENHAAESKNIDMGTRNVPGDVKSNSGYTVKAMDNDHGSSLRIKTRK
jgi:hypothetical protein